jgi:hypothetical protein
MTMVTELLRSRPAAAAAGDVLPNYWNPQRADPEVILPSGFVEVRAFAGVGSWGDWTIVEAPTSQDLVLLAAHMSKVTVSNCSLWVQVGVDPTGDHLWTARAEFAFHCFISGSGSYPIHSSTFRLAPYLIPAGSSVAVRGRVTSVDNDRFQGFLALVSPGASWVDPWPNTYIAGGRVTRQRRSPTAGSWLRVPAGSAWAQAVASAPNDMLVTAVEINPLSAQGFQGEVLEVGVGAAGSEVVFSRAGIPSVRVTGWAFGHQEFGRKALVLAGERVAVRELSGLGPYDVGLYFEDL